MTKPNEMVYCPELKRPADCENPLVLSIDFQREFPGMPCGKYDKARKQCIDITIGEALYKISKSINVQVAR